MLRFAMYLNVLILTIISIVIFINVIKKKKSKDISIIYLIYIISNYLLFINDLVETGWNLLFIKIAFIIDAVLLILSICYKKARKENISIVNKTLLILIPIIIFIVPFSYETYLMNKCSYIIKYNYQNGIVQSDNTYIAIVDNKPINITLCKNIFNKKDTYTLKSNNLNSYEIKYQDDSILIEKLSGTEDYTENIKNISENIKEKYSSAIGANIYYLPDENSAIISIEEENNCLYYNNGLISTINAYGGIEEISFYD